MSASVEPDKGALGFLRYHWFDVGIILSGVVGAYVLLAKLPVLVLLLWAALGATFIHQAEEYRYPGYFPGVINSIMFSSKKPDRYPLNANTALVVNLPVGWLAYFFAAAFNVGAMWLGIAVMLAALGQFILHGFAFNIRGKMLYNPGMITSIVLYLPIAAYYFYLVITEGAASVQDWILGVVLAVALAYLGIFKVIDWMKDENTPYVFPARFLMPAKKSERLI